MITAYKKHNRNLLAVPFTPGMDIGDVIWFDMLSPTPEEEKQLESLLEIDAPTPEEMREIEVSSRLYAEHGALYIITSLVTRVDSGSPEVSAVTFILKDNVLVTLRYAEPKAFGMYLGRVSRGATDKTGNGFLVFLGLIEAVIDRLSDTMEMVGRELDQTSRSVFRNTEARDDQTHNLQELLKKIGRMGDLNGKVRESLLSLSRTFSYVLLTGGRDIQKQKDAVETYAKDIASLSDHCSYLNNKVNLLLDATLGLINTEQNAIIKIFSVAAVVFLPPTLIASIYGMNFLHMPELAWKLGYPFAVGLMVVSAILPFWYFKHKKWL